MIRSARVYVVFVVALVCVNRIFGLGCGPKDGDLGGDCISSDGCSGHCNDESLDCDVNNKCVKNPYWPPPREGCEERTPAPPACAATDRAYVCSGEAPSRGDCRSAGDAGSGDGELFCCPETCVAVGGEQALCGGGTTTYSCSDVHPPVDAGACVLFLNSSPLGGWASCCATTDTCFAAPQNDNDCLVGNAETYCTGNAPAPDSACATTFTSQPGVRAYCCPRISDAGADSGRDL